MFDIFKKVKYNKRVQKFKTTKAPIDVWWFYTIGNN